MTNSYHHPRPMRGRPWRCRRCGETFEKHPLFRVRMVYQMERWKIRFQRARVKLRSIR